MFQRVNVDIQDAIDQDWVVSTIHAGQEKFKEQTEEAFKYLQVFTAICDSFCHGANDVANSLGPLLAIVKIQKGHSIERHQVPIWILAVGAVGLVIGLATYGYNIMRAIGLKLVAVTPSRGFAIELGTAIVIGLGTFRKLPLSTTHC